MTQAEVYHYPLYSIKRFPTFLKYANITAGKLKNEVGGAKIKYLADMLWCNLRYGACDTREYLSFKLYKKSSMIRNQFLTKRRFYRLIKTFDWKTFENMVNKDFVNEHYSEFINRKWIKVTDETSETEIRAFINKAKKVIVKPSSSEQGMGVFKVTNEMDDVVSKFINERNGVFIIEECLENHPLIDEVNPSSLNTMRVYSIIDSHGDVHVLNCIFRVGITGSVVDNWFSGGIGYHVNEEGVVDGYGIDKQLNKYAYHPSTNKLMIGFKIPHYQQLLDFCKRIMEVNKKAVFCGLDIAITPNGFSLVEINFPGGHEFMQVFEEGGMYQQIMRYLKNN